MAGFAVIRCRTSIKPPSRQGFAVSTTNAVAVLHDLFSDERGISLNFAFDVLLQQPREGGLLPICGKILCVFCRIEKLHWSQSE